MQIRFERTVDAPRIHDVNQAAFGSATEADIVDALRATGVELISLVAEEDGDIVGHILFSPVTITGVAGLRAMALAPMAAIPDRQRHGIGSALVHAGLEECRRRRVEAVFVIGHPEYYPRFGFTRASGFGVSAEFDVPDDAFMALELIDGAMRGQTGVVHFHEVFRTS
jgi:putative acetyltransferase